MKLPKRTLPIYEIELPVSKTKIKYRPYTVKEERIIDMASSSDSDSEKYNAVKQVLENCASVDIENLHPADVDFLYLKLYATSESPEVNYNYNVEYWNCGIKTEDKDSEENGYNSKCPKELSGILNINSDIEIEKLNEMDKYSEKAKGNPNSRIIELTDGIKIQLAFKTLDIEIADNIDFAPIFYKMLVSVFVPNEDDSEQIDIITKEDISEEEFIEFYNSFLPSDLKTLKNYILNSPQTTAHLKVKCKVCKKEFKASQSGLINFLI